MTPIAQIHDTGTFCLLKGIDVNLITAGTLRSLACDVPEFHLKRPALKGNVVLAAVDFSARAWLKGTPCRHACQCLEGEALVVIDGNQPPLENPTNTLSDSAHFRVTMRLRS
ncbi:hypothetical protein MES5069_270071 [Mesorhizobium escarrei]|uniref:Uncharacterized protein n=1 Tax=Mesorhizobium escarrei TaxID=666018 RepID=A0ABM9DVS9_9HYPH|nr:hypothetical protein MES5069_270071 [Mesorhizobium escarrei]